MDPRLLGPVASMTPPRWTGRFVGIPYVHQGRERDGVDCWGLVRLALNEAFGREVPDYAYAPTFDRDGLGDLTREVRSRWLEIPLDRAEPGDAIVLRVLGQPCHCGVIAGGGWMLHSLAGHDSVVERYATALWGKRIDGVYRWPAG
jgi:cell wall-associated NlpC family hydrolase